LKGKDGSIEIVTADNILIATGGRPTFPLEIPNIKEMTISSDDIFWMRKRPGKTLVVGASYIGLECAGFMHGLGIDVTVMVRSIFLRGFDQQLANKIGDHMEKIGIKIIRPSVPTKITKKDEGDWKTVEYKTFAEDKSETINSEDFETILIAVGRSADTHLINLNEVGVKTAKNGKIIAGEDDRTSVDNIYAIGDVVEGRLELTPTAIMAGKLLALRLFAKSTILTNYSYVPTTVFTPLEYGCCGYSEEAAVEK
jgi:pyruvate/2-oxoglutarate dehydrogenase complex dihydrolipoamide dehydrogenase (E3) component